MSKRVRSREVCADCSALEPRWASVNRGVLICDECCSIHRGLGRHSSQVRHLTHTPWPPSQLQMVQTLYGNGANSIWEHSLLDPSSAGSGKRKGNPQDRVHPNKTEFIKAKYQMLAFVHRMPCREDDNVATKDLSKQLHSSVRTGNLETCLRLLSLGAQANFFHPEKGNTPLHIAAKAGQVFQVELLAVYGADPGALDTSGKTPIDYARQAGHQELADRLVEIQYELTDRLTFYLCGRRPGKRSSDSLDLSEFAKAAKKKLQSLSNHQFEELAMDVYDEVDRRETDAVWLVTQNHSTLVSDATVVPFLPVNPEYSSTRNQGRQKLARFNAHEFATLVIDILTDAKRRQWGNSCEKDVELILKGIDGCHGSDSQDNDQPDYDSVASDEDPDREVASRDNGNDRRTKLSSLQTENSSLRWQSPGGAQQPPEPPGRPPARGGRPMSMYETGSGSRPYPSHRGEALRHVCAPVSWLQGCSLEGHSRVMENDYDNTPDHRSEPEETRCESLEELPEERAEADSTLPGTEDVICKTEQITKNIQELLRAAQENKYESFLPCSEKIHGAVREMATLFPKTPRSETVRGALCLLTTSAGRLHGQCQKATLHSPAPADLQLVTQQVIQCAYDIAKAAKQLVTVTTKENSN
uniref:GIT ArfGAP 2 n=1 Tax=Gadus morhua TaxID=8049 RepID=A0A8C5FRE0_GADMO